MNDDVIHIVVDVIGDLVVRTKTGQRLLRNVARGPFCTALRDRCCLGIGFSNGNESCGRDVARSEVVSRLLETGPVVAQLICDVGMGRMRIHQDREAAAGRPLDRTERTCGDPGRRVGLLSWLRKDFDVLIAVELAFECEALVRPGRQYDFDGFAEARGTLVRRHTEDRHLRRIEAPSSAPVDPTVGQDVEQSNLLSDSEWMVERRECDGGADS